MTPFFRDWKNKPSKAELAALIFCFVLYVILCALMASGQEITSLQRFTNAPAAHSVLLASNGTAALVNTSNFCHQARLTATVPAGTWAVFWNYSPQGARWTGPNCFEGQAWMRLQGAIIIGPATNATIQFPVPPSPDSAFFQLRRI